MNKYYTLILPGLFTTGFNLPANAAEQVAETRPATEVVDEEPDCD